MSTLTTQNVNIHNARSSEPAGLSNPQPPSEPGSSTPLLPTNKNQPPIAGPEIDDLDDDEKNTPVTKPYPGVDDGFFETDKNNTNEKPNPDAENIPLDFVPEIENRAGGEDDPDGVKPQPPPSIVPGSNGKSPYPVFPYAPGYGPGGYDVEIGTIPDRTGTGTIIPDVNVYQHKKTLAQGMMDLALFSANANQLRYVLESFNRHPYFYPSLIFLGISLILQVAVGIGLVWNATYNVKDDKEICIANKINNFTIIGIFLVTVINVFISAFGVANAPAT